MPGGCVSALPGQLTRLGKRLRVGFSVLFEGRVKMRAYNTKRGVQATGWETSSTALFYYSTLALIQTRAVQPRLTPSAPPPFVLVAEP